MSEKKIMLVCAAGMSTSLLVSKMKKIALEKKIDADIFAEAASKAEEKSAEEKPDIMLLGPQVRYLLKKFEDKFNFPVEVINMRDYGTMNGENVLKKAIEIIDNKDI
ncbi:PTS sugar transporter subunit IIB [Liquorilactobacillus mali]|uniref:PTS sugar transporter subunit IIB n=1 Tax=Liquorilactobacillus mali TaxID=1618 RepID=UPI00234FD2EF|nr:PTS sugar transporter subunit IIB [Liquorilactobacillus mali]MDC7952252.1 PTS sugar transporter subunit IIB [Liquorilactobacillus mali]MDN7145128.1 PTS sugar transporter subunit IIB [Liquorilactobacillus mali]